MPTEPSPDNFNVNWREDPDDKNAIKLLVSKEELVFMQQRSNRYHAWRNASMMDMKSKQKLQPKYNPGIDYFNYTADQEGPWLDFLIAGFPKCGTTTMMGTLSQLAPMPAEKDVCELPTKLMTLVYEEWPTQFGSAIEYGGTSPLLLRGTKCPSFVGNLGGAMMKIFSNSFKKTKFIIGIRFVGLHSGASCYLAFWSWLHCIYALFSFLKTPSSDIPYYGFSHFGECKAEMTLMIGWGLVHANRTNTVYDSARMKRITLKCAGTNAEGVFSV
jgi:hypothetical protein